MSSRVYNFSAGPAMLPTPVMQQIQKEFLNYHGIGSSIVEVSHRSSTFKEVLSSSQQQLRQLLDIPENYKTLYVHGGARMQFSAIPMNLMQRNTSHNACFFDTGIWSKAAMEEAKRYGNVQLLAGTADEQYRYIPDVSTISIPEDASYAYLTSNNTLYGTCWKQFPEMPEGVPLVVDATSDLLSRHLDISKCGLIFAGTQKNLGVSGLTVVIIREDLLGHAIETTPSLLNYEVVDQYDSMLNTPNTFAVYAMKLVLDWVAAEGGVAAMEAHNLEKSKQLHETITASSFYQDMANASHHSLVNVTFDLPSETLLEQFLAEAHEAGLHALKGHRLVGGARASMYNAMPLEGAQALCQFMQHFESKHQ